MKHISEFGSQYSEDQIALANEIAERLDDPASLAQFLRYTAEVPHQYLREALNKACATPESQVRRSRAAIFVNSVNKFNQYGNGRLGY